MHKQKLYILSYTLQNFPEKCTRSDNFQSPLNQLGASRPCSSAKSQMVTLGKRKFSLEILSNLHWHSMVCTGKVMKNLMCFPLAMIFEKQTGHSL